MARFTQPGRTLRAALFVGTLACLLQPAQASLAVSIGLLDVRAPWCLATRSGANAAGYLVVENKGDKPARLTGITSPAAQRVSIHESRVTGGVATMTLLNGVEIPARTAVAFAPGGRHLMLEVLRRRLDNGDRVPVTLWFQGYGPVRTSLVVRLRPPMRAPQSSMRM